MIGEKKEERVFFATWLANQNANFKIGWKRNYSN